MKAIRMHEQGGPGVLRYEEVPRPVPGPGDVLIRVHAAGVNPPDWYSRSGFTTLPPELRPTIPLPTTPGTDVSGVVEQVTGDGGGWAVGDEVFGLVRFPNMENSGKGYAEHTTSPVGDLARKPANLDHVHAAGVPMAGLTAYQFLYVHLKLARGRRVLINGAAGGVGHFALQLAKARDAHVVAVASGRHEAFLRDLGADEFVDYTTTDVAEAVKDVDHLLDTVGGPHAHRLLPTVRDGGTVSPVFLGEYHPERAAERGITFVGNQVRSSGVDLAELARLIEDGAVRVGIDSVYPLAEAARAHERAERGHIQGKIVLSVRE